MAVQHRTPESVDLRTDGNTRSFMAVPGQIVADPAALGLAAFALTTFLLSVKNAGWTRGTGDAWLGFALFYGGLAQFAAGVMEFRNRNVFGATAFGTYGAFWLGLFGYFQFAAPHSSNVLNDLGWIALSFVIFNTYMLLWSTRVNLAVFAVFLTLEATLIVLSIAYFTNGAGMLKTGGILGVITAAVAWYASAAVVVNGMGTRRFLPVGKPRW